jgi:hypothetical protein
MIGVLDAEGALQELISRPCRAELAVARRISVCQVSTKRREVGLHVGVAVTPAGRVDCDKLNGRAIDVLMTNDYNIKC